MPEKKKRPSDNLGKYIALWVKSRDQDKKRGFEENNEDLQFFSALRYGTPARKNPRRKDICRRSIESAPRREVLRASSLRQEACFVRGSFRPGSFALQDGNLWPVGLGGELRSPSSGASELCFVGRFSLPGIAAERGSPQNSLRGGEQKQIS